MRTQSPAGPGRGIPSVPLRGGGRVSWVGAARVPPGNTSGYLSLLPSPTSPFTLLSTAKCAPSPPPSSPPPLGCLHPSSSNTGGAMGAEMLMQSPPSKPPTPPNIPTPLPSPHFIPLFRQLPFPAQKGLSVQVCPPPLAAIVMLKSPGHVSAKN